LHNRTAKIESDPHRTRSGEGSVPSLGNRTGFSFPRLNPIRVWLKPSVTVFEDLSDLTNQPSMFWIKMTNTYISLIILISLDSPKSRLSNDINISSKYLVVIEI
jgi:hypothetical protein